jgi:hypothetical protein
MKPHIQTLFAAILMATLAAAPAAYADSFDDPTQMGDIKPGETKKNSIDAGDVGFRAYNYTATVDGWVQIKEDTIVINKNDNEGIARRPFLRVLRLDGTAEAWSTNGHQQVTTLGQSALIIRIKKGDRFTVIATIAANNDAKGPSKNSAFTLTVKELANK